MTLQHGQILSHYRIEEKIGAGGMGEVYRARDEHLDRDVAVKVLPAGTLADEASRRRFRKEAKALSKLNHPNIQTVHDFDTQGGVDFLVTEYVPGVTLSDKLSTGALSEKEVVGLGMQLVEGLVAAHDQRIVHRDLKPGNLRVTPDGRLKILDFGLARLVRPVTETATTASLTETQAVAGTLPYMAPEQLRGEKIDARTDLYAVGVVLYEMATGHRPFEEKLVTALAADIQTKPPPPPGRFSPDLSSRLEDLILKCLEKSPDHRYQSAKEVGVDLRRLTAAAPVVSAAHPPPLAHRRMLAAVTVVLVLAVTVAGVLWFQQRAPSAPSGSATVSAKPSVAILPFQNLSPDRKNEYFSDGITEEITSKLSRIKSLEIASRTSAARFKTAQEDIKQIGQELGVRYLLEGSVRKAGNRVRITAQLIDSSTGFHVWAEDFDGELKDVFAVQEQTALKIAEALNLHLSPPEAEAVRRRYTQNPEAYDAYLRGWALIQTFHHFDRPEKLEAARKHFEQALAFDPDYPLALAGLSGVEAYYFFFEVDRTPDHLQRAEELARRALALDPQLAEAHVALGDVYGTRDDLVPAADEFRQALRLDPRNAYAWGGLAWTLNYQQPPDPEEAEKAAREAIRLQPGWFYPHFALAWALRHQARYEEAIAALEHALQLNPAFRNAYLSLGKVYLAEGNYNAALAQFNKARRIGETPSLLVQISAVYAALGNKEKSLAELEKALADGYRDFADLDSSPYFDSLRADPRFQDLLRRMNFPD